MPIRTQAGDERVHPVIDFNDMRELRRLSRFRPRSFKRLARGWASGIGLLALHDEACALIQLVEGDDLNFLLPSAI